MILPVPNKVKLLFAVLSFKLGCSDQNADSALVSLSASNEQTHFQTQVDCDPTQMETGMLRLAQGVSESCDKLQTDVKTRKSPCPTGMCLIYRNEFESEAIGIELRNVFPVGGRDSVYSAPRVELALYLKPKQTLERTACVSPLENPLFRAKYTLLYQRICNAENPKHRIEITTHNAKERVQAFETLTAGFYKKLASYCAFQNQMRQEKKEPTCPSEKCMDTIFISNQGTKSAFRIGARFVPNYRYQEIFVEAELSFRGTSTSSLCWSPSLTSVASDFRRRLWNELGLFLQ